MRAPRPLSRLSWLTLAGACMLSACGGGGGGPAAPTVTVDFQLPAAETVTDAGTPLTLSARALANDAPVDNGTTVRFAANGAAAGTARTQAGVASVTLNTPPVGTVTLQATVDVAGQTATAQRTVWVRPAPQPLELLVPAYFYPTGNGARDWQSLATAAQTQPGVRITAILNPSNGLFSSADTNIQRAAAALSAAGGTLVGYVGTRYGTGARSLDSVRANIDAYLNLYGRGLVSGFFIDEMASTADRLPFYRAIYDHIKSRDPALRVIGNPGQWPAADYVAVADTLVTFEGRNSAFQAYDTLPTHAWMLGQPNRRNAVLVHDTLNCRDMQVAVQRAALARSNVGHVFMTSLEYDFATNTGNPWAGLPPYWSTLVQTVGAVGQGTALPAC